MLIHNEQQPIQTERWEVWHDGMENYFNSSREAQAYYNKLFNKTDAMIIYHIGRF